MRPFGQRHFHHALLLAAAALFPACTTIITNVCPLATATGCCPGSTLCVASGSIYVATADQIIHFSLNPAGGALTQVASVTTTNRVRAVISPFGNAFVYAIDGTASAIVGYAASGNSLTPIPGSPFSGIDGQARPSSDGQFLYMPGSAGTGVGVFSIGQNGALTFLNPVPGVPQSTMPFASTVVTLAPRFLYVLDQSSVPGRIDGFSVGINTGVLTALPSSPFTILPGTVSAGLIAQSAAQFIFISLPLANVVSGFSITPTSGALTPVPGSPFSTGRYPTALASDFAGNHLYVTNELDGTVTAFSIGPNGALTVIPGSPFAAGMGANGAVVDNLGHLYVINTQSNNISAYSINANSGALTPIPGSPFPAGNQPNSIAYSSVP